MAKFKTGALRHQVAIKKYSADSTSLDTAGRESSTSSTIHATVKASITKLTGQERQIAHQEYGIGSHEMHCWYVPNVSNKMWVEAINGKRFNIIDVEDVEEKHHQLKLLLNSETS